MRAALAAVIVLSTLAPAELTAVAAGSGGLATVGDHPRRCGRIERKLAALERHNLAHPSCGVAEGCKLRDQRRWTKLADTFADDCVALNHVQVLGTHNSYHIEPRPELMAQLLAFSPMFQEIQYTHPALADQFGAEGIRQIELDVYADPQGGLYAHREGLAVIGENPDSDDPQLRQPGFKVLHIQDIDFETRCVTFVDCLNDVKSWSDDHPGHLPIMILVEAEDEVLPPVIDFVIPIPFGTAEFDALDAEIRSVFPPERLITPDDVRQGLATVDEAVRTIGWPTLKASHGKVLFCLDNGGKRGVYRTGHPVLENRVLFTNSNAGSPDAGFVEQNDPHDPDIPGLVDTGYIVRTRADADTLQARSGDTTDRDAAIASGAQYVSTDYPVPDPRFGTGYFVALPDASPGRCNPVNAPAGCRSAALEHP